MKGFKTIDIGGLKFEVEYTYHLDEPAETGPEAEYLGCDGGVDDILSITYKGEDFTMFFIEVYNDDLQEIKTLICEPE
jgi:hypothetical protein